MSGRAILSVVAAVVGLLLLGQWWSYNGIIGKQEAVAAAWSQVESNYQRRTDLVPSLVDSVERFLEHESEVLSSVVEKRGPNNPSLDALSSEVAGAHESSKEALAQTEGVPTDSDRLTKLAATQADLGNKLSRLLAVAENYPTLRSADQFLRLQAQLEGTENRINIARMRYNEAVRAYNSAIRRFPGFLIAGTMGLSDRPYFEADDGASEPAKDLFE